MSAIYKNNLKKKKTIWVTHQISFFWLWQYNPMQKMYIYVIYNIFKIFYLFSISFLTIFSAYVHSVETMQMTYPWNKVGYVNFNTERTNWSGKKKRKAKSMMTSHQFYCLVTPQLSHQSPTDHETLMYSLFARFSTYNNHGDKYIYMFYRFIDRCTTTVLNFGFRFLPVDCQSLINH